MSVLTKADPVEYVAAEVTPPTGPPKSLPLRSRVFLFANIWFLRLISVLFTLHEGLWLGLLDPKLAVALGTNSYTKWPKYLSRDHNLSGLFKWEEESLSSPYFADCQTFMVAAAGGGREVIALARRGKSVTGFDCCHELLEIARELVKQEKIDAEFLAAPANGLPSGLGTYDAVIVGWGALTHMLGHSTRVTFLRECALHVKVGGPILVSYELRNSAWRERCVYGIARAIRALRFSREPVELGDRIFGDAFSHPFHQCSQEEIERELIEAGFKVRFSCENEYAHCVATREEPRFPG